MATYGYIRVSTTEQVSGTSLETQQRQIEGAAAILDRDLTHVFADEGVSGSVPLAERPMGAELRVALQAGDTVIAAKLDRMFRDAADALNTAKHWKEQGINLVLVDLGLTPVNDSGVAKLLFGILAAVAEMERERIAERTLAGRHAKRAAGGAIGGSAPFGYTKIGVGREAKLLPVPQQQAAIQTMYEGRDAGMSLRQIVQLVMDRHGQKTTPPTVSRVLRDRK